MDNKGDKEVTDKADSEEEAKASMEVKVAKASMEVKVDKDSTEDKEVKVMVEDLLVKAAMAEIQEVTEEEIKEDMAEIRVKEVSEAEAVAATHTQVMVSLKTTKTPIRAEAANRI